MEIRPIVSPKNYDTVIRLSGLTSIHRVAFDDALSIILQKKHAMKRSRKKGAIASCLS